MEDYYKTLGLSKGAGDDEIKKAYRKMAMKYHPDRNSGNAEAESKFKEVSEAYQVLSDKGKRESYDRMGHNAFKQQSSSGGGGFNYDSDAFSNFGDIFGDFFGGGFSTGGGVNRQKGQDARYDIEITLEEAAKGVVKELKYRRMGKCGGCKGTGGLGGKTVKCTKCNGRGEVKSVSNTIFGQFVNVAPCDGCRGRGKIPVNRCGDCGGRGIAMELISKSLSIPKGVDNGNKIVVRNYGEIDETSQLFGDLYVFVKVKEHLIFKRDGNNINCVVPIKFITAANGGKVEVPTLDGKVFLNIPKGTQSERMFYLKGRGVGSSRYSTGDQIIKVRVVVPTDLTSAQMEILEKFDNSLSESNNSVLRNFLDKMGQIFN